MKRPGETAVLEYWSSADVDRGDVIETTTGRRYLVVEAKRTGGKDPHWRCTTQVMSERDRTPEGATTHQLRWFPRGRRKR